jgi:hypothetical protein
MHFPIGQTLFSDTIVMDVINCYIVCWKTSRKFEKPEANGWALNFDRSAQSSHTSNGPCRFWIETESDGESWLMIVCQRIKAIAFVFCPHTLSLLQGRVSSANDASWQPPPSRTSDITSHRDLQMERDLLIERQPQHSEGLLLAAMRHIFASPLRFVACTLSSWNNS